MIDNNTEALLTQHTAVTDGSVRRSIACIRCFRPCIGRVAGKRIEHGRTASM